MTESTRYCVRVCRNESDWLAACEFAERTTTRKGRTMWDILAAWWWGIFPSGRYKRKSPAGVAGGDEDDE